MKVIVFTNEKGGVAVCYPTSEIPIEEVQAKDTPEGSIIVKNDALPNDDADFFDAWVLNNGVVTVDIIKAKELTKQRLRVEREPLLAAQDVLFQRALETGQDTTAIVAEKQRLRDITNLVDICNTLEELRLITVEKVDG